MKLPFLSGTVFSSGILQMCLHEGIFENFCSNVKLKQNLRKPLTNFLPHKNYKFLTIYNTSVPKDEMTG